MCSWYSKNNITLCFHNECGCVESVQQLLSNYILKTGLFVPHIQCKLLRFQSTQGLYKLTVTYYIRLADRVKITSNFPPRKS